METDSKRLLSLDDDEGFATATAAPEPQSRRSPRWDADDLSLGTSYFARPLCAKSVQPRQFEFHQQMKVMAVGTCEGDVVVLDWEDNKILHKRVFNETETRRERKSILALSWLKKNPRMLLAGSSSGMAKLYALSDDGLDVVLDYGNSALTSEMTSIHCNCLDQLLVTSGYTSDVRIFDVETGKSIREYKQIHDDHINICRFANNLPNILLTCSFDNKIKLWDNRCNDQRPIHTSTSDGGNVMVCFSPDDMYFLASSVDNEVKQYSTVDGRLNLQYDIKPMGSCINYTRSYYANDGDLVVSGSSNDDVVHICCSRTGKVIRSIRMYEGRRHPNLYIQSLRGNPIDSNRFGILVCYRYNDGYEVVDIDLNRSRDGKRRELPYSLATEAKLSADYEMQINSTQFYDFELVSRDKNSIHAHRAILLPRWRWFRANVWRRRQLTSQVAEMRFPDLDGSVLQAIVHFVYTGRLKLGSHRDSKSEAGIRQVAEMTYLKSKPNGYQLPRLCDLIECYLRQHMTLNNAVSTLRFACKAGAKKLYDSCIDFIFRYLQFYDITVGYDQLCQCIGEEHFRAILSLKAQNGKSTGSTHEPYFKGRTAHSACQAGRWVYLLGGYYSKGVQDLRCVPVFDTVQLEWTLLPTYGEPEDIPEKLCFHSVATVGNYLLTFGGGLRNDFLNDLHFLDLRSMTWKSFETTGASPCARRRHSAITIGDEMWIFGGRVRGTDNKEMANDLYKFNMTRKHWSEVVTFGAKPMGRCGHTMTYLPEARKLVVIGGFTQYAGLVETGMVHSLDLQTLRWEEIKIPSPRPSPRCCHSASLLRMNGLLYVAVFGGSTSGQYTQNGNQYLQDLWLLSAESVSGEGWRWTRLDTNGPIPPRFTHSAFLTYADQQERLWPPRKDPGSTRDRKGGTHGKQAGNIDSRAGSKAAAVKAREGFGMQEDKSAVRLSEDGELDTKNRHLRSHALVDPECGRLTIWAGGNNEDFLDDMWHLEDNHTWKRTGYIVSGSLPEPIFHEKPTAVSHDMKVAFLQYMNDVQSIMHPDKIFVLKHPAASKTASNVQAGRPAPNEPTRMQLEDYSAVPLQLQGCRAKDDLKSAAENKGKVEAARIRASADNNNAVGTPCVLGKQSKVGTPLSIDLSFSSAHSVIFVVEGQHVHVSKALLATRSSQFRTMFTSKMKESRERIIKLPEVSLRAFLFILYYLYTGDIPTVLTPTMHKRHQPLPNTLSRKDNYCVSDERIRWVVTMPAVWLAAQDESEKRTRSRCEQNQWLDGTQSRKRKSATDFPPSKVQRGYSDEFKTPNSSEIQEHDLKRSMEHSKSSFSSSPISMDCHDLKTVLSDIEAVSARTTKNSLKRHNFKGGDVKEHTELIDPLEIIVLADRFAVDDLRDLMETAVSKHLTDGNVCYLLRFAEYYTLKRLMQSCIMYVVAHFHELTKTGQYNNLNKKLRSEIEIEYRKIQGPTA